MGIGGEPLARGMTVGDEAATMTYRREGAITAGPDTHPRHNVRNSATTANARLAADPVVWPGCVYAWLCTWQE